MEKSKEIRCLKITTSKECYDNIIEAIALCKYVCLKDGQQLTDGKALDYICLEFKATYGQTIIKE